jgi:hypothetical protein
LAGTGRTLQEAKVSVISGQISLGRQAIAGHRKIARAIAIVVACMTPWHSALAQGLEPDAKVTACSDQISTCGCTITKSGFYEVTANISSSQGLTALGDCIDIKASNVVLEAVQSMNATATQINNIVGAGSGIGIHILKGSSNDFLELFAVLDWEVGLMVEGNNNVIHEFFAETCAVAGVELNSARNNTISALLAIGNQNYGLWIRQSVNNKISLGQFLNNQNIQLYVGCSDNGPVSEKCRGVGDSKGNQIYGDLGSTSNGASNGKYGIVIDLGNTQNLVTNNSVTNDSIDGLFDANSNCDQNKWLLNRFDSSNVGCIQ